MRAILALALLLTPAIASAQAFYPGKAVNDANPYPVKTTAVRSTSTVSAGTIAAANTYQSALAADPARLGCSIQNKSVVVLRVFIGAPGSATDATAFDLPAGAIFSCSAGSVVISDQISIAGGTVGAGYVVSRQ